MSELDPKRTAGLQRAFASIIYAHWKFFLIQGLVMMGLGLLAAALPQFATIAVEILVGWLVFIGGAFRVFSVLRSRNVPSFWLSLIAALLAVTLGLILILQPLEGVVTLTMILLVLFIVEGIIAILIAFDFRRHQHNWGWILVSGIVDLFLAYLIWRGWPGTAAWAIGLLVGVNMFFLGLSLTMTALAARTMGPS